MGSGMMTRAGTAAAIGMVLVILTGLAVGSAFYELSGYTAQNNSTPASTTPFRLTLVITDGNYFNGSSQYQPAFYVMVGQTLASSASITLPADRQIIVTIVNHDSGIDQLSQPEFNKVMGTADGSVFVAGVSNLTMSDLQNPNGVTANLNGQVLSSFSSSDISHTFTIISGSTYVNIPISPSSVEVTSFVLSPGSYIWQCECACGSGTGGWGGAMMMSGWMTGIVEAN